MAVTPKDIWDELTSAGASAVQAAGLMGNAIHESGLNPEANATDSNGFKSYGLWQWNEQSYPNASQLVTGRPEHDLKTQVTFLTHTGGLQAASGSTVSETASNFAAKYERCQGCQAGGAQNDARAASAATVAGWAANDQWPSSAGSASQTAILTSASAAEASSAQKECLWSVGWGPIGSGSFWAKAFSPVLGVASAASAGELCIVRKSQVRAIVGLGLLSGGIILTMAGIQIAVAITLGPKALRLASSVVPAAVAGKAAGAAAASTAAAPRPAPAPPQPAPTRVTARQAPRRRQAIEPQRRKVIQGRVERSETA